MKKLNTSKPIPSSTTTALSTAATAAIAYLAGIGWDLTSIDWSLAINWLIGLTGVGAVTGLVTSDRTTTNTVEDSNNDRESGQNTFKFSARSIQNLSGVHSDLVQITTRALELSKHDFAITSGVRTPEQQKQLVDSGISPAMNSRHLHGLAVDIAIWKDNQISWQLEYYKDVSNAFQRAASELGIVVEWGGDWRSVDGPHFQLSKAQYPDTAIQLA